MPSIGNITVKRISRRHFIPSTSTPIVKGAGFPAQLSQDIPTHPLFTLMQGTGGGVTQFGKFIIKGLVESITLAGIPTRTVTTGPGIRKTLSETVSVSESVVIRVTKARAIFETVNVGDNVVRQLAGITLFSYTDTSYTYSYSRTVVVGNNISRSVNETVSITEGVTIAVTKRRTLSETVSIGDNVNRQLTISLLSYTNTSFTSSYTR